MKLHIIFRTLSILCYSFIFVPGMMIALPFILVLTVGICDAYPGLRLLLILADLGLILLGVLSFRKKSKLTIALHCLIYFMLLSPLLWMLTFSPNQLFGFLFFTAPFGGFVLLYPLSVLSSWLDYRRKEGR
jgi:hypothetical protein